MKSHSSGRITESQEMLDKKNDFAIIVPHSGFGLREPRESGVRFLPKQLNSTGEPRELFFCHNGDFAYQTFSIIGAHL